MGVKGLRAGVDASGKPYVAGGREGIYFRERISTGETTPKPQELSRRGSSSTVAWIVAAVLAVIVVLLLVAR